MVGVKVTKIDHITHTNRGVVDHMLGNVVNFTDTFVTNTGTSFPQTLITLSNGVVKLVLVSQNLASQLFGTNLEINGGRCSKGNANSSVLRIRVVSIPVSKVREKHNKGIVCLLDVRLSEVFTLISKLVLTRYSVVDNPLFSGNLENAVKRVLLIEPVITGEESIRDLNSSLPCVLLPVTHEHHRNLQENLIQTVHSNGTSFNLIRRGEEGFRNRISNVRKDHIYKILISVDHNGIIQDLTQVQGGNVLQTLICHNDMHVDHPINSAWSYCSVVRHRIAERVSTGISITDYTGNSVIEEIFVLLNYTIG